MSFEYEPTGGLFDSDRPYDGQPHTDLGDRGKLRLRVALPQTQIVHRSDRPYGSRPITLRDIYDSMIIGLLHAKEREHPATGETISPDRIDSNEMLWHQLGMDPDFDPIAAVQNALVEVEKRLGIYPNVEEN